MRRFTTSAASALGSLVLASVPAVVAAQVPRPVALADGRAGAPATAGLVGGVVHDEDGTPVAGAMVSALGSITAFAVTDADGRYELRALPPGPYLIRVHLHGYRAPRGQVLEVRPGRRVSASVALRREANGSQDALPVLAAGVGAPMSPGDAPVTQQTLREPAEDTGEQDGGAADDPAADEFAWRLRHLRRSILKEGAVSVAVVTEPRDADNGTGVFGRTVGSPLRAAGDFFDAPFSGQVNLLTTSSFDDTAQLFEGDNRARGITYIALGAPAGKYSDWVVRGALTEGDLTSWIVAGAYRTQADAPGRHRFDVRLSYSTQRYDGGNPEALRAMTDGSRNAGMVSGFDTFLVNDRLSVAYGARYSHYDYLDGRTLISPRVGITLKPSERFRVTTHVSRRSLAPGAEEFVPPADGGVWLPPQRTFSAAVTGGRLTAERATHVDVGIEHDLAGATFTARFFRQHVDGQLVTLFGAELPDRMAADLGHYLVGDAGAADVDGWSAGVRTAVGDRVHGSVEYSVSRANWSPGGDVEYLVLLSPSAVRSGVERIHDVSTSIETEMPETDTRILVLYRVSDGFSRRDAGDGPSLDTRFDVQVRQSLPFMDFSAARWEMLVGVRNFFRDPAAGQSIYDELLVVRPPKRIVGGLTLRF